MDKEEFKRQIDCLYITLGNLSNSFQIDNPLFRAWLDSELKKNALLNSYRLVFNQSMVPKSVLYGDKADDYPKTAAEFLGRIERRFAEVNDPEMKWESDESGAGFKSVVKHYASRLFKNV